MEKETGAYNQPPPYGFATAPPPQPGSFGFQQAQHYPYPATQQPGGYPPHSYVTVPPPQPYPGPPPQITTVVVTTNDGFYKRNQRNKPQSNAVGAASLIFVSGGMNLAWSIGFRSIGITSVHVKICWFIAVIIGALISGFLANKVPKKFIFLFSGLLVLIDGIIFAATDGNIPAITAALYLDGIANGLSFAPLLALAGEVAVPYMRGMISTSLEQMSFGLGICLQIIYTYSWSTTTSYSTFGPEQMHGLLSAIYGVLALALASFLTIESPVIMLANGEEQQAIDALRRLQRPFIVTTETYAQLEEHKLYLAQNKDISNVKSIELALSPFVRLSFLRGLNAMSISHFIDLALWIASASVMTHGLEVWPFIVFAICRWMGQFITAFIMESAGRKKPILIGLLVCSGLAFGMGGEFYSYDIYDFYMGIYKLRTVLGLLCAFQFFAGVAFTPTSAYLSECYPLGVKQHFIGFTLVIEMIVYIIINVCDFSLNGVAIYFIFIGALYLFAFIAGIWILPETKQTTLRQAQNKFKSFRSTDS